MENDELIEVVQTFVAMFSESDASDAEFAQEDAGFLQFVLTERVGELPEELVASLRKIASDYGVTI